jgi:hypothetical protein
MDSRTRETGRRLLSAYYAQQKGPVAYIDESFRGLDWPGEFPFYLLSAVLLDSSALSTTRELYLETVGSDFWHTTKANKDKEYDLIDGFAMRVEVCSTEIWISIQLDLRPEDLELARREAMLQLIEQLAQLGCTLAVYEQRNTRRRDASDASVVNLARKSGLITGGIAVVGSKPWIEPLLWGPDLVCWRFRQALTGAFGRFAAFQTPARVLDASGIYSFNEKRPETAAALNPGPVSPAPLFEAKAIRSSSSIMPNYQKQLQDTLHKLPKFTEPLLPPHELRAWLKRTYPN